MAISASPDLSTGVLSALFASSARVSLLRVFTLDPSRAYYQRQLESATGLALRAIQRELERLVSAGLVYRRYEGNRAYYQIDAQHPVFQELRNLILKAGDEIDRLRGHLASDPDCLLVFLSTRDGRVLVVTPDERQTAVSAPGPYQIIRMKRTTFAQALAERPESLAAFLERGVDLLGRRDDMMWRRIELAGFDVPKARGVA